MLPTELELYLEMFEKVDKIEKLELKQDKCLDFGAFNAVSSQISPENEVIGKI